MTRAPSRRALIADQDLFLFNEGTHRRLYRMLGAHPTPDGTTFAVWAPNATRVSVIGDFNDWNGRAGTLEPQGSSGIWAGSMRDAREGALYKYRITSRTGVVDKADPLAFRGEPPPRTASIVCAPTHDWRDADWMEARRTHDPSGEPWSVYELHLGSWRRMPEEAGRSLSYREIAEPLIDHVRRLGFTHVEFMPLTEHPFYGSWGYQTTGYFSPTARYGQPADLMWLIDRLHQAGIGVILDWVPSHFPKDAFALAGFDGTHLYEHADPRRGHQPDWDSYVFNYGRHEVRSFLVSSALFWLDRYHVDAIRVDAVASMLYLDYSRADGEWLPNEYGGRENLEAMRFLRQLNEAVYAEHPGAQTIAEESTAWPMVSRPTHAGGLGFGMKWDMGWMHDTLQYLQRDPAHRLYHHREITFRALYAFSENYMLPLSHDEVVHGKGSLLGRMSGDDWQRRANLRLLFAHQFAQPGKKLLFMGAELGQWREWSHERSLDWHLLDDPPHAALHDLVGDLNRLYRSSPALHDRDFDPKGFEWIAHDDAAHSVTSFLRWSRAGEVVLIMFNFTPVPRGGYRVGVPQGGAWRELLNTDAQIYGGSGVTQATVTADAVPAHGRAHSLALTLPPLAAIFLQPAR